MLPVRHGAVVIEIIERRSGHVHEPDEAELCVPFGQLVHSAFRIGEPLAFAH